MFLLSMPSDRVKRPSNACLSQPRIWPHVVVECESGRFLPCTMNHGFRQVCSGSQYGRNVVRLVPKGACVRTQSSNCKV